MLKGEKKMKPPIDAASGNTSQREKALNWTPGAFNWRVKVPNWKVKMSN